MMSLFTSHSGCGRLPTIVVGINLVILRPFGLLFPQAADDIQSVCRRHLQLFGMRMR
jgi:hypothetical protein